MEKTTKILIADENEEVRAEIKENLKKAGFLYVEEANNGEDTLQKITRIHPDVVIVDLWLSKMDGIGIKTPVFSERKAGDDSSFHGTEPLYIYGSDRCRRRPLHAEAAGLQQPVRTHRRSDCKRPRR